MSGSLTIRQARLVLPDRVATGDLVIEDGVIARIGPRVERTAGEIIDGTGLTCLPGVIDTQVRFTDLGWPDADDVHTGSRAAAAGGVTTFLGLPDGDHPLVDVAGLHERLAKAAERSAIHFGFFLAATADNLDELAGADRACGIQVWMGGADEALVLDDHEALEALFAKASRLLAVHPEDGARLRERALLYEDTADPEEHARLHDVETSLSATRLALDLAHKHGVRLHLQNISTAEEVELLAAASGARVTTAVALPNLLLEREATWPVLGADAIRTPPLRSRRHVDALWRHLLGDGFAAVASDHAPRPAATPGQPVLPGLPGVEWLLPLLLDQVVQERLSLRQLCHALCEGPARCYRIPRKGRLEVGYDGDVVLADLGLTRTLRNAEARTRCGWGPYAGREVTGWPVLTAVLGRPVFRDGQILEDVRGRELTFAR